MPVFDFSNMQAKKEPVRCTYAMVYSDNDHASPENPILVIDNQKREWKHHSFGIFANPNKQTTFEFEEEDGTISADILKVDARFVSLLKWLGEHHIHIQLSGKNVEEGYAVYKIQEMLRPDVEFIAAHPMAGREVCGVENSDSGIFKGANYIVVPTEKNTAGAIELCRDLGEKLGFHRVAELSVEKHDEMIAFLSQLTHCIAVTLMCCNNTPDLEYYTGDSFRDLTRIARINDEMWSELFLDNKDMLLAEMRSFKQSFETLYEKIETGDRDGIREMMRLSTERRKRFNKHL